MDNETFVKYAASFQTDINLGLSRIRELLSLFSNPQKKLRFIHIAGTNGKGSVCSFLGSILTQSGLRTGKFISPYMLSVNDSISIDNVNISDEKLHQLLNLIYKNTEKMQETPSQFEIQVTAAILYFCERNCDIVVWETGMGGLTDATNIIPSPLLCVITRIDFDHKNYLGETLSEIVKHKAGIIKKGGKTITLEQSPEIAAAIKQACDIKNNKLIIAEKPEIHTPLYTNECFSYGGYKNLICGISGEYQVENAILAVEAAKELDIEEKYIFAGLKSARNPGRFETISRNPLIIFDGAHNPNGMAALLKSLKRYFPEHEKYNFVMGFMADKEIDKILEMTSEYAQKYSFVDIAGNGRALSAEKVRRIARRFDIESEIIYDLKKIHSKNGITVVCGSLYLYKQILGR